MTQQPFKSNLDCCSSSIAASITNYQLTNHWRLINETITFYLLLFTLLLTSCSSTPTPAPTPAGPQTITVLTHDSFAIGEDVITAFEAANNAKVVFLQSGDAGAVLNQAILTKDAPLADILFGVDNTFLSRALDADIFEAYQSPVLSDIADEYKLDPSNRALPVDYGDVCINYDKNYFAENNLAVPQTFEDLAKPEYKDLVGCGRPCHIITWTCLPACHPRALWRWLSRLLEEPERKWRCRCGWLGNRLLHKLLRLLWQGTAANGRLLRLQPRRGSVLCLSSSN